MLNLDLVMLAPQQGVISLVVVKSQTYRFTFSLCTFMCGLERLKSRSASGSRV
jgi:hypothetical protein